MFSFLYRVFYDKTLSSSYIRNGAGYGIRPLLMVAVCAALCLAVRFSLNFSVFTPEVIAELTADMPEVVIEDGKIVAPANYRYTYVAGKSFFAFDTTDTVLNMKDLPDNGVYISADALFSVKPNVVKRVPLASLFEEPFSMDAAKAQQIALKIVDKVKVWGPVVVTVFSVPILMVYYLINVLFFALMSYLMTRWLKAGDYVWAQRMRLATLSIMPAFIITAVATVFGVEVSFKLACVITLIYMYCFVKDKQPAIKDEIIEKAN